jgi:hypothetical protein
VRARYKLCTALAAITVVGCGYNTTRIPENALVAYQER